MLSHGIWENKSWKNSLTESDRELIMLSMEKLPYDSKIVIFLHYWREIEFKEIAEVLGIKLKEVEFIHNATLQLLSKVFGKRTHEQRNQLKGVAA